MLKNVPLGILGLAVLLVLATSKFGFNSGIDKCDASRPRNIILSKMVTERKVLFNSLLKMEFSGNDDATKKGLAAAEKTVSDWTATIENTIQLRYDDKNKVRYCQATIDHKNFPAAFFLAALSGSSDGYCMGRFAYQIHNTTDGREYVQWRCLE